MKRLSNNFGWSATRGEQLDQCARAYFWACYGNWEGWLDSAPAETRLAYRLKKMENRWAWSGNALRRVIGGFISALLARREPEPAGQAIAKAKATMRGQFAASKAGPRARKDPTGFWGLLEHEYGEPVSDDDWRAIWNRTETSLANFYAGPWPVRLRDFVAKDLILAVDSRDGMPPSFTWRGITLFAVPDLAVRTPEGGALVVDWKSGRPSEEHASQLLGYALYIEATRKVPRDRVVGTGAYLLSGEERAFSSTAEDFTRYEAQLEQRLERARELLVDRDLVANKPKPITEFTQTEDRSICAGCRFRRLCNRENP